ncbi:MAG TPA: 3-dehydroquinate synthase family protein [Clostridia bacterium]|nr:3-dehydroquinate synthase family protein [Clostridia bacterium]
MIKYHSFDVSEFRDNTVIVTDAKLPNLYSIYGDNVFILPEAEFAKTFDYLEKICAFCAEKNIDKNGKIVAVGGGSVGDVAGFASAIYKRGIGFTNYPTTLLAMADSSIGGKTAINLDGVKNLVGAYHNGDVVIDFNFLKTLDERQIINGWGEIAKYTFISKSIEKEAGKALQTAEKYTENLVKLCANFKYNLTKLHPKDDLIRRKLNMGHTLGHAIEMVYELPHGTAVLNGLYYELLIAERIFKLSEKYLQERRDIIRTFTDVINIDINRLLPELMQDKKNANGKVCFVLPMGGYITKEVYLSLDEVKSFF